MSEGAPCGEAPPPCVGPIIVPAYQLSASLLLPCTSSASVVCDRGWRPFICIILLLGERSEPHTGVFNRDFT